MTSPSTDKSIGSSRSSSAGNGEAAVTMYSTQWCGYCHRLKSQLDREGISFDIVDIEQTPDAVQIVESANNGNQTVPTLVYSDGTAHTNPSLAQVKQKLESLAS